MMTNPLMILAAAGRHGPALLCGGVLIGLAAPPLAEMAHPLMGVAVFIFTLGAFLKVDAAAFRAQLAERRSMVAVLAWTTFGVPLATCGLVALFRPGPDLALGILLVGLAPPVGSAAAMAAMLGLNAPLALLATVVATLASPFYLPPFASLLAGVDLAMDPFALSVRLGVIVGGAGVAACMLRRYAASRVVANPHAITGISVLGLIAVAIGVMRGMPAQISADPTYAAGMLVLAFLANAGMQFVGAVLFGGLELRRALTIGLVSGNRNVTLVAVAAAPILAGQPAAEMFVIMSVFPIFMLPVAMRRLFALMERADASRRVLSTGVPARLPR